MIKLDMSLNTRMVWLLFHIAIARSNYLYQKAIKIGVRCKLKYFLILLSYMNFTHFEVKNRFEKFKLRFLAIYYGSLVTLVIFQYYTTEATLIRA